MEIEPAPTILLSAQIADIWAVMSAIGGYQLSLQLFTQNGQRYEEGLPKLLQYVTGIPALIILVIFMLDPDLGSLVPIPINKLVNAFGFILFNLAGMIILISHRTLGKFWSGDLETKADHVLVDTGPYRWVRHPLYSSYFVLALGLFAISESWLIGFSMLVYFMTVAARTPIEEKMLVDRLGERYLAYQKRTGRFFPRLGVGDRARWRRS